MALTKKDLQEVVSGSEERLIQRIEATEKRIEEKIEIVRSDVKILETVISKRIENTDRKIDSLSPRAVAGHVAQAT